MGVFGHSRQAQVSQELRKIGFYLYTVDGPRVTGEYYSAKVPNAAPNSRCKTDPDMCEFMIQATPSLSFVKAETFGYSLNGKEFLVCQINQEKCNSSYTQVADSYKGTSAKILSGTNGSNAQDKNKRPFLKTVDTGWTDKDDTARSNILSLWGMADLNSDQTDVYTLSLTDNSAGKGAFAFGLEEQRQVGQCGRQEPGRHQKVRRRAVEARLWRWALTASTLRRAPHGLLSTTRVSLRSPA